MWWLSFHFSILGFLRSDIHHRGNFHASCSEQSGMRYTASGGVNGLLLRPQKDYAEARSCGLSVYL